MERARAYRAAYTQLLIDTARGLAQRKSSDYIEPADVDRAALIVEERPHDRWGKIAEAVGGVLFGAALPGIAIELTKQPPEIINQRLLLFCIVCGVVGPVLLAWGWFHS